jgi:exodeoxyribonuclease III
VGKRLICRSVFPGAGGDKPELATVSSVRAHKIEKTVMAEKVPTQRKRKLPPSTENPEGTADAKDACTVNDGNIKGHKGASKKEIIPPGVPYQVSMRAGLLKEPATRILSWNVAGLRAVLKKDPQAFTKLVEKEQADIICVQEIKLSEAHISQVLSVMNMPGWHATWNCCTAKAGYSGTATFSREKPLSVKISIDKPEFDTEGRIVVTEHKDFWLINVYVPNSGEGLKRLHERVNSWDPALSAFCKRLEASGKYVVLAGDLNCAHRDIDIHSPKTNLKSAGFTIEERNSFQTQLIDAGFEDSFRKQHPDAVGYTYFSHRFKARENNKGWRLDYFLVSRPLLSRCHDSFILRSVEGSDHVPIGLVLKNEA